MTLFEPARLGPLSVRNRIVMAPMCMFSCAPDGLARPFHAVHLGSRASGGVGLVIAEATAVESRGRITEQDLGIWNDAQVPGLSELVKAVHDCGAPVILQLAHAGRKARVSGEAPVAPSALAYSSDYAVPEALNEAGIREVISAFVRAAERARDAGFDGVEIHGAHGYLINAFLSPLSNRRTDAWGGDAAGRARILAEIVAGVRGAIGPERALTVRVSGTDWAPGGNSPEDVAEILRHAHPNLVDAVHVSSGGAVPADIPVGQGYQLPAAKHIRTALGRPVIAGGLVSDPGEALAAVRDEGNEFVFLGRALLRDPYWPLRAAEELGAEVPGPDQYRRATPYGR